MSYRDIFVCPHCGEDEALSIEEGERITKDVWRLHVLCKNCHMMWSVKVSPVTEE